MELGTVFIFGTSPISDLSTLSPMVLLGDFKLQGTGTMEGLRGFFKNIDEIPGDLHISDQTLIADLSFLSNLKSVGGSLTLQNNTNLDNFKRLSNLESVGLKAVGAGELGMNIINGPSVMCGLENLATFNGLLYHNTGTTLNWAEVLELPQPACP